MTATTKQMKLEAYGRLKDMHIHNDVIKTFMETGTPIASNGYFLAKLSDDDLEKICEFEKEHGVLVYYVMVGDYVELGTMQTYLYVTGNTDEWKRDREDISDGVCMAYVRNVTYPYFSEFGSVVFEPVAGVVVRTA